MQPSRKLVISEANEAIRTSPSLRAAARRLGLNVSTLSRAIKVGTLAGPRRPGVVVTGRAPVRAPGPGQTFEGWAEATFDLTVAELALVKLAQQALDLAADRGQPASVQLAAMAQFRASIKDLRLPVEDEHHGHAEETHGRFPRPVA